MRFEERIKSEMKQQAAAQGHSMSRYVRGADDAFPFRSDCTDCGSHIELGFGGRGEHTFAPRGRAPFERCPGRRRGRRKETA